MRSSVFLSFDEIERNFTTLTLEQKKQSETENKRQEKIELVSDVLNRLKINETLSREEKIIIAAGSIFFVWKRIEPKGYQKLRQSLFDPEYARKYQRARSIIGIGNPDHIDKLMKLKNEKLALDAFKIYADMNSELRSKINTLFPNKISPFFSFNAIKSNFEKILETEKAKHSAQDDSGNLPSERRKQITLIETIFNHLDMNNILSLEEKALVAAGAMLYVWKEIDREYSGMLGYFSDRTNSVLWSKLHAAVGNPDEVDEKVALMAFRNYVHSSSSLQKQLDISFSTKQISPNVRADVNAQLTDSLLQVSLQTAKLKERRPYWKDEIKRFSPASLKKTNPTHSFTNKQEELAQLKAQRALLNNRISLLENTDILGIQIKRGNLRTKDHDVPQDPEDRKVYAKHNFFLEDLKRYNTHRFW